MHHLIVENYVPRHVTQNITLTSLAYYVHKHCNQVLLPPDSIYTLSLLSSKSPFLNLRNMCAVRIYVQLELIWLCILVVELVLWHGFIFTSRITLFAVNFYLLFVVIIFRKLLLSVLFHRIFFNFFVLYYLIGIFG